MTDWDVNFASLAGGLRSQAILAELARLRAASRVALVGPVTLTDLAWAPSQQFAIHRDPSKEIWHAGHVNAALMIGDAAIIGTQTGGVWLVDPARRLAPPAASHPALPLSDDWSNPDVTCLAFGPDGDLTFFAGCAAGGGLYIVELRQTAQGVDLQRASAIPTPSSGDLYALGVLPVSRRLVIAAANGVWWAPIPTALHQIGLYAWTAAQGLPYQVPVTGLAVGPEERVVVALDQGHGIYQGTWATKPAPTLTFAASTVTGATVAALRRTSLATSEADRQVMYALAAATDGTIGAILRSSDGGAHWTETSVPDRAVAGTQGSYNNCLAVSPYDSSLLAFGWQHACPYVSHDGGQSWTQPQPFDPNLHRDWHALTFPQNSASNTQWLCGGNDGGFIVSHDLLQTNDSQYNKHLGTIQFYKNFFDASSRFPGLVAGGTQDNGNLSCELHRDPAEWLILEGGDGGNHRFIDAIGALLRTNNQLLDATKRNYGAEVRIAFWDPAAHRFTPSGGAPSDVVVVDGTTDGLTTNVFEAVAAPAASRGEETLYACAGKDQTVYALFAKADGSGAHFSHAGSLNEAATAVASYDGHTLLVGTEGGNLLEINPFTGQGLYQPLAPTVTGQGAIVRIQATADRAFALSRWGTLLRWTGSAWQDLPAYGMVTFALHPARGSQRVFAAWDDRIWVSDDNGDTWSQMLSVGLPAYPHISTLKIAADGKGGHVLYLAAYGRSVWQAQLDYERTFTPPRLPSAVADILVGVLDDGGGLVRSGNSIIRVPPYPPTDTVVAALASYADAASLPPSNERQARLAALQALERTVARELTRLGGPE